MVSIIILSLNPPATLFEQIRSQTYQNFEIIIAKEKGIVKAMNIALGKAKGDIFVRIDDDVSLPEHWLEEIVKGFEHPQTAGVTGPTIVPIGNRGNRDSINFIDEYQNHWFVKWLFDGNPMAVAKIYKCGSVSYGSNFWESEYFKGEIDHLEGTNWAMRTHLIRQVGGFDEKFDGVCEWYDTDVEEKIKKLGYKIKYNGEAWVRHILGEATTYGDRFSGWSRIKNWLRFHYRHSKFHYKKVIWLIIMIGYFIKKK